jgi:hypothetical protein
VTVPNQPINGVNGRRKYALYARRGCGPKAERLKLKGKLERPCEKVPVQKEASGRLAEGKSMNGGGRKGLRKLVLKALGEVSA